MKGDVSKAIGAVSSSQLPKSSLKKRMAVKPSAPSKEVSFPKEVSSHTVIPYSSVHGCHPRNLAATRPGIFKYVSDLSDAYTGKGPQ